MMFLGIIVLMIFGTMLINWPRFTIISTVIVAAWVVSRLNYETQQSLRSNSDYELQSQNHPPGEWWYGTECDPLMHVDGTPVPSYCATSIHPKGKQK